MKRALLLAAPLALAACTSVLAEPPLAPPPPPPPPPPPQMESWSGATASIGFGGQATLNGVGIRPVAVVEDSRCPINARCVWAGRLILAADIAQRGAAPARINLTLGQPLPVAGGTLTLMAADPPKLAGAQVSPASQFTFALSR